MLLAIQSTQPQLISNHRVGMKNQKAQSTPTNNVIMIFSLPKSRLSD